MTKLTVLKAAVLVALLGACGGGDPPAVAGTKSSSATAAPTPAGTAPTSAATSSAALPGDIARAIEAAMTSGGSRLEALLTPAQGPCVVNPPPAVLRPPACPAGVPAGTSVPALVTGGCPDQFTFIDPSITFRVTSFDGSIFGNHLIGVADLGRWPLRYAALFGAEKVGWLGFDEAGKLIGAGGGGDCPAGTLRPKLAAIAWLAGPNWEN